jgi:hypothetical protein
MTEIDKILALPPEEWENFFRGLSIEETKSLIEVIQKIGE